MFNFGQDSLGITQFKYLNIADLNITEAIKSGLDTNPKYPKIHKITRVSMV